MLKYYSVPHLLHIETTYACNSNCLFCYNPKRENFKINYKKLDLIVKKVSQAQVPHVYLIGGEPSLVPVKKLNQYINRLSENSSVTIVTNGLIYLEGLSKKLACIGIPLHGDKKTHESLTRVKGGYEKTIETIKKYVSDGFDVRCIPVLMSKNYNQIYDLIKLAAELGMESVFVDKFESGGLGSKEFDKLKPTNQQFKTALTQMIKGQKDFGIKTGFGTAIPYCLDERLISEKMYADCGVGTTFAALDPEGNLRICNQSPIVYGNILKQPLEEIWKNKRINEFRDLSWVTEPCKSCPVLESCVCGCKVDLNCSEKYCIDYALREKKAKIKVPKEFKAERIPKTTFPKYFRTFKKDQYFKLILKHKEKYAVTRYQTVIIDDSVVEIAKAIINGIKSEKEIISRFKNISEENIRILITQLEEINAIKMTGLK